MDSDTTYDQDNRHARHTAWPDHVVVVNQALMRQRLSYFVTTTSINLLTITGHNIATLFFIPDETNPLFYFRLI